MKKLILLPLFLASGLCHADPGFYLGGTLGHTVADLGASDNSLAAGLTAAGYSNVSATSQKHTSVGYKAFLGYQFDYDFAVEGGYAYMGKYNRNVNMNSGLQPVAALVTTKARALFIDGVANFPFTTTVSAFGKFGYTHTMVDAHAVSLDGPPVLLSSDASKSDPKVGFGFDYAFRKNLGLRGEFEHYFDTGGNALTSFNVNVWSLGLKATF